MAAPKISPPGSASPPAVAEAADPVGTKRWKAALLLFAAFALFHDLWGLSNWELEFSPEKAGTLGWVVGPWEAEGYPIVSLMPGSPLAAAGAKVGDHVVLDRSGDIRRAMSVEERVGLTLRTAAGASHLFVQPVAAGPVSTFDKATVVVGWIATLLTITVGVLIGWRRAESFTMRMFSASLLSKALGTFIFLLPAGAFQSFTVSVLAHFLRLAGSVCFLYFVLAYTGAMRRPSIRRTFIAYTVFSASLTVWLVFARVGMLPFSKEAVAAVRILGMGAALVSMAGLLIGWWRATGVVRQRLAWLSLCMGAIYAIYFGLNAGPILGGPEITDAFQLIGAFVVAAANAGLGYAVLRHRILDFGFAVNRALVYGTTSIIVAALFMLGAQLVNRLIRFDGRADHSVIDLGIGLALALGARQIVRWVDPRVQKIFFRHWHAANAKLQQFRVERIHGIPTEAVKAEFVQALRGYTGADACALYLADDTGTLRRRNSTMDGAPDTLATDQRIALALRDDPAPQRISEAVDGIPAALALPMSAHGRLLGAILLGPKPEGDPYRPDELTQLASSAHQVALELELRRLKRLEAELEHSRAPRRKKTGMKRSERAR